LSAGSRRTWWQDEPDIPLQNPFNSLNSFDTGDQNLAFWIFWVAMRVIPFTSLHFHHFRDFKCAADFKVRTFPRHCKSGIHAVGFHDGKPYQGIRSTIVRYPKGAYDPGLSQGSAGVDHSIAKAANPGFPFRHILGPFRGGLGLFSTVIGKDVVRYDPSS